MDSLNNLKITHYCTTYNDSSSRPFFSIHFKVASGNISEIFVGKVPALKYTSMSLLLDDAWSQVETRVMLWCKAHQVSSNLKANEGCVYIPACMRS